LTFSPNGIITFSSDFGTADGYAAAMKGCALSISEELKVQDISHEIPSWDIRRAAFALWTAVPLFPPGSVHVVVVDPGVGTDRAALIALTHGQVIVAPDNGILSLLMKRDPSTQAFYSPEIEPASTTFHGRDVFAPCGAQIAAGLLPVPGDLVPLEAPVQFATGHDVGEMETRGTVLCSDKFGNLITSVPWNSIADPSSAQVLIGTQVIETLAKTFGDHKKGSLVFLKGSSGLLEVSCVQGSAKDLCKASAGATVHVSLKS